MTEEYVPKKPDSYRDDFTRDEFLHWLGEASSFSLYKMLKSKWDKWEDEL